MSHVNLFPQFIMIGNRLQIYFPRTVSNYPVSWVKINKTSEITKYVAFRCNGYSVPAFLDFEHEDYLLYTLKMTSGAGQTLTVTYRPTETNKNDSSMFSYIRDFRLGIPDDWSASSAFAYDSVNKYVTGGVVGENGYFLPKTNIYPSTYPNKIVEICIASAQATQNWMLNTGDYSQQTNTGSDGIKSGWGNSTVYFSRTGQVIISNYLAGKTLPWAIIVGFSTNTPNTQSFFKSADLTQSANSPVLNRSLSSINRINIWNGSENTYYFWFRIREPYAGETITYL